MNTPGATLGRRARNTGATICISGISENEKKTTLQGVLGDFGHVVRIEIPAGRRVAFVEFEDKRDANEAVRSLDRKTIGRSTVSVKMADDRTPGEGGSKGKGKDKFGRSRSRSPQKRGSDRDKGRDRDRDRDRGRDRDRDRDRNWNGDRDRDSSRRARGKSRSQNRRSRSDRSRS
eukprot:TRINITY_DN12974_c1_g1_i1.p1 TRINITY_DN12974_c1_g1~~TRINITY_DN12974_c1_g1_i1.p1  ORF type:complete len:175 (-),score=17.14 TRINITY_DN12974_c1_g1_i1:47-571(-)